ncbi:MAG: hypothetical protein ACI9FR_001164 [Cryomorphaceae bacterium]|jgi:hypothetical protein
MFEPRNSERHLRELALVFCFCHSNRNVAEDLPRKYASDVATKPCIVTYATAHLTYAKWLFMLPNNPYFIKQPEANKHESKFDEGDSHNRQWRL